MFSMTVRIGTFACNPVSFPFDATPLLTLIEWLNYDVTVAMYTLHLLVSKIISTESYLHIVIRMNCQYQM